MNEIKKSIFLYGCNTEKARQINDGPFNSVDITFLLMP